MCAGAPGAFNREGGLPIRDGSEREPFRKILGAVENRIEHGPDVTPLEPAGEENGGSSDPVNPGKGV